VLPMPGQNPGQRVGHAHTVAGPQIPRFGVYSHWVEPALHSLQPRAQNVAITMTTKNGRTTSPNSVESGGGRRSVESDGRAN